MEELQPLRNFDVERTDSVVCVTIDTTAKRNALTERAFEEFLTVVTALNQDEKCRCVVLTGTNGVFSAGADVNGFRTADDSAVWVRRMAELFHSSIQELRELSVPLVVGVNGVASGGGFGIALHGDLVLMADSARFEYGYPQVGLPGDGGITYQLPRRVGVHTAIEIALLQPRIDAESAVEMGLATESVGDDAFRSRLAEIASDLAEGPTRAYGLVTTLLGESTSNTLAEQLAAETRAMATAATTADHREGVRAFIERQSPEFKGR